MSSRHQVTVVTWWVPEKQNPSLKQCFSVGQKLLESLSITSPPSPQKVHPDRDVYEVLVLAECSCIEGSNAELESGSA